MRSRRGLTLIELMIALVIVGIIGAAFTNLLVSQGRFFDGQKALRDARQVSRGALNILLGDLRMAETGGAVRGATHDSLDLDVPYAFGIFCHSTAGSSTVSMLPVDSLIWASAGFSGYAWRDASGGYTYIPTTNIQHIPQNQWNNVAAGGCGNSITTLQGGHVVTIRPALSPTVTVGYPILLFQRVVYTFRPSQTLPGRIALYRRVVNPAGASAGSGVAEELAVPFDTSAKFRYYVLDADTSQATPGRRCGSFNPTIRPPYCDVRGIELVLDGLSERRPSGSPSAKRSQYTTAVFFQNRSH